MLRWTNRLHDHLESRGETPFTKGRQGCYWERAVREAEFVSSEAWAGCEKDSSTAPPFTFSMLKRIMIRRCETQIMIRRCETQWEILIQMKDPRLIPIPIEKQPTDEGAVDILWLSNTEFVSCLAVNKFHRLCSLEVSSKDDSALGSMDNFLRFRVYTIGQVCGSDKQSDGFAFKFLNYLLSPTMSAAIEINIDFSEAIVLSPVESVLSAIPTSAQSLVNYRTLQFVSPPKDLIRAFWTYPFHRNVRLCFPNRYAVHGIVSEYVELAKLLRECKQLRHLQIPYSVLAVASAISARVSYAFARNTLYIFV
jgi:hypothetical protein